jgi:uncharacterized protein
MAANGGRAIAQNSVGAMYALGQGVPCDDVEAVKWYARSPVRATPKPNTTLGSHITMETACRRTMLKR